MSKDKKSADSNFKAGNFPRSRSRAFCPLCDKPVDLISFEDAANFSKVKIGDIESQAESGALHRIHNSKGKVLICGESLFKNLDERETEKPDLKLLPRLD